MSKTTISVITLMAFLVFSFSCYSTRTSQVKSEADWHGKKGKVYMVITKSGEHIEFSKDNPGRIVGFKIEGTAYPSSESVSIPLSEVAEVRMKKFNVALSYLALMGAAFAGIILAFGAFVNE